MRMDKYVHMKTFFFSQYKAFSPLRDFLLFFQGFSDNVWGRFYMGWIKCSHSPLPRKQNNQTKRQRNFRGISVQISEEIPKEIDEQIPIELTTSQTYV